MGFSPESYTFMTMGRQKKIPPVKEGNGVIKFG